MSNLESLKKYLVGTDSSFLVNRNNNRLLLKLHCLYLSLDVIIPPISWWENTAGLAELIWGYFFIKI